MLELPAVLGAVQRGELEAVVGENTGERVKKGPFKQKKVKVYLNLKSYTEHEKETKQQSKFIQYFLEVTNPESGREVLPLTEEYVKNKNNCKYHIICHKSFQAGELAAIGDIEPRRKYQNPRG